MTDRPKRGGRRQPPGGRPPKGNVKLACYVKPETLKEIDKEADRYSMTRGEIVERWGMMAGELHVSTHLDEQTQDCAPSDNPPAAS